VCVLENIYTVNIVIVGIINTFKKIIYIILYIT
jgi:hypothetical protein